ncbi:MAG: SH3 domain-containing protein [Nodosilinea sp.]
MAWGLCSVLSFAALGCRDRGETVVESVPAADEQPLVSSAESTATPETATSAATPKPHPPEPGVGGTGEAINPSRAAQLITAQEGAQVNLRSQPTTASNAKGYGLMGDPVQLLRSAQRSDGTWYYVKFEESGAEGWIRNDFINTAGRATPLSQRASNSSTCEGLMESMSVTAFYDASGFHLVRFVNVETKNTFDATLSRQGSSNAGQPLYQGSATPPAGGSYPVALVDLSGGNPRSGSEVAIDYLGIEDSVPCQ